MKILLDTNILFSALLRPGSVPARVLLHVAEHHTLVLCEKNLSELREIVRRKASNLLSDTEVLIAELPFELVPAPENSQKLIRDPKDAPILNAAILADVDYIVSGDKDFLSMDMEHPKCITAAQYLELFAEE